MAAVVLYVCLLSLAEWGVPSYLPFSAGNVERLYEFAGLAISGGGVWLDIERQWNGVENVSAAAFTIFLYTRLYRWWWEWMPKYLFFAAIGAIGIGLVVVFKRSHAQTARTGDLT